MDPVPFFWFNTAELAIRFFNLCYSIPVALFPGERCTFTLKVKV